MILLDLFEVLDVKTRSQVDRNSNLLIKGIYDSSEMFFLSDFVTQIIVRN
jgi:hypothetical protein